jgi:aldose 1-epimerase
MVRSWIAVLTSGLSVTCLSAGEVTVEKDLATGWKIYTLRQGETTVRVAPAAGANVYSVMHRGVEYFRVPDRLEKLPGVSYGNPILYPMPNRVKGAKFSFERMTFKFPRNGDGNFMHGLVHSEEFEVDSYVAKDDFVEMTCGLKFAPGSRPYELFPFKHTFRVTITVYEGAVRWKYEVDNSEGESNLPFGVAFHPYVIYQKSRKETYLQVPAAHLMESTKQLPSGKLLELDDHPLDAREPRSLDNYAADDVFLGMKPGQPARVAFRDVTRSITFWASEEFTHLVVWTPDRPYFSIENQTCSTDAHNLFSQGKGDVAHLQICSRGEKKTGSVEYRFK